MCERWTSGRGWWQPSRSLLLSPPTLCNSTHQTHTHISQEEGARKSTSGVNQELCWDRLWCIWQQLTFRDHDQFPSMLLSYLPVLVRTMRALAQHLKDDSTAPTATASEWSLVTLECLLSSSNSCLWKTAASASRAIWAHRDHEGRVGGLLSITHTAAAARRVIHTTGSDRQMDR